MSHQHRVRPSLSARPTLLPLLAVLALTACGRSLGASPVIERVTPAAATNDQAVVVEILARDVAAAGLPRVFLDDIELAVVEPRSVDALDVTVPAAIAPAIRAFTVVMPDGTAARGDATFTVLAGTSAVR